MINQKSVDAVNASQFSTTFRKPLYNTYCFSQIPQTIKNQLLGQKVPALPLDVLPQYDTSPQKVLLLFVDGFGWQHIEKYSDKIPFLKKLIAEGVMSKLTSQFPSTTPVQLTTINSGEPVTKHGVYEWFYYEPKVDALMSPLLFSYAGDKERNTLGNIDPKTIFPHTTLYQDLAQNGVKSYVFQSAEYASTPYSTTMVNGATNISFTDYAEGFQKALDIFSSSKEKTYGFFYYSKIDTAAHQYGVESKEVETEVLQFFALLEKTLFGEKGLGDTLFLMTADHGQISCDPAKTIYLDKISSKFQTWTKKNRKGELLVPAGSCRDMFLHIEEQYIEEALAYLKNEFQGIAEIYTTQQLLDENMFGIGQISSEFLSHVGNIVILPYAGQKIWWYGDGKFEQDHWGDHGGLIKEEVDIPFLALQRSVL